MFLNTFYNCTESRKRKKKNNSKTYDTFYLKKIFIFILILKQFYIIAVLGTSDKRFESIF